MLPYHLIILARIRLLSQISTILISVEEILNLNLFDINYSACCKSSSVPVELRGRQQKTSYHYVICYKRIHWSKHLGEGALYGLVLGNLTKDINVSKKMYTIEGHILTILILYVS